MTVTFDEGLRALIERGWRFQHLRNDAGHVVVLIGSYGWPEYYDRLHVHGEDEAIAARAVMDPRPAWVWDGPVPTSQTLTISAESSVCGLEMWRPPDEVLVYGFTGLLL